MDNNEDEQADNEKRYITANNQVYGIRVGKCLNNICLYRVDEDGGGNYPRIKYSVPTECWGASTNDVYTLAGYILDRHRRSVKHDTDPVYHLIISGHTFSTRDRLLAWVEDTEGDTYETS